MKCQISSEFSQVSQAAEALHLFGEKRQLGDSLSGQLELILVEAINNIIEHAYQGKAGYPIHIHFNQTADEVVITLQDEGMAVPEKVRDMAMMMPDEQGLPEGGWGLGLIQILADRIEFSVEGGMNALRLGKKITP